ncbi:MAG: hypothetical protein WA941_01645 [Nitrososphaeraceae archaeon]
MDPVLGEVTTPKYMPGFFSKVGNPPISAQVIDDISTNKMTPPKHSDRLL